MSPQENEVKKKKEFERGGFVCYQGGNGEIGRYFSWERDREGYTDKEREEK